jgi:hypothetical protein
VIPRRRWRRCRLRQRISGSATGSDKAVQAGGAPKGGDTADDVALVTEGFTAGECVTAAMLSVLAFVCCDPTAYTSYMCARWDKVRIICGLVLQVHILCTP